MLKKLWDSIVEKAVEAVLWAVLGSTALALFASAALLQWTQTPWFWRRFVMAAVLFGAYTGILRFAPRWMIPKAASREPKLYLQAHFESDVLRVRVFNDGPTDEFSAEVWLVGGIINVFSQHANIRWLQHGGETRQIARGGTQYLELLRVPREVNEENVATLRVFLLSPAAETQLHPRWLMNGHVAEPFEVHLRVGSMTTGESVDALITVNLAKVGPAVRRDAVLSKR